MCLDEVRIPGTGSLVGCRLCGRTESDMTKATQQQQRKVPVLHSGLSCSPSSFCVYVFVLKFQDVQCMTQKSQTLHEMW